MKFAILVCCSGVALGLMAGTSAWGQPTAAPVAVASRAASAGRAFADCSAAYGGRATSCVHIACAKPYDEFIGTWRGAFHAYVRAESTPQKPVYRPYTDSVSYSPNDCYRNTGNGDILIIGHQLDTYPAFHSLPAEARKGLLIFGRTAQGTPFMRTVGDRGSYNYALVYRNDAASLSIWRLQIPAAVGRPPMTFTTIDGRRPGAANPHTRDVQVTMSVGPETKPYWRGVIAYGTHSRQTN